MSDRERVLLAINHQEPDRIPLDFSAEPEVVNKLLAHFNINNYDTFLELMGISFRHIKLPGVDSQKNYYIGPNFKRYPDGSWSDIWGIRRRLVKGLIGSYDEVCYSPLAEATTVEEVENYTWPDPSWFDCSKVACECERYSQYARVGGGWGAIFGDAYRLQGMAKFLENMVVYSDVVKAIINKVKEFYIKLNIRIFEVAKGGIDIYYFGNDFGTQTGLLMSLEMWREFFADPLQELINSAKNYGIKVMFHSCGSVREIIPDLINMGIDILDPVQVRANGMDPEDLKRDFGDNICFHGGVDTQQLLPFCTEKETEENVKELMNVMKSGGGFILAPSQSIQPDVPLSNILAMYRIGKNCGKY